MDLTPKLTYVIADKEITDAMGVVEGVGKAIKLNEIAVYNFKTEKVSINYTIYDEDKKVLTSGSAHVDGEEWGDDDNTLLPFIETALGINIIGPVL